MAIDDIARRDVVTADIEATLTDIAHVMRDQQVGSAVVVDGKGTVAGVLTDRDLVVSGLADELDCLASVVRGEFPDR